MLRQDSIVALPQRIPADRFHLHRRENMETDFETGMALNEMLFDVPHIQRGKLSAKNHVRQVGCALSATCFHAFGMQLRR
jgi:hypothetical protein